MKSELHPCHRLLQAECRKIIEMDRTTMTKKLASLSQLRELY